MTKLFICPICGGHLKIGVDSGVAVCGSCGESVAAEPAQLQKIREVCAGAERMMRQNTVAGCEEAIRQLESISYAADVDSRIDHCRAQLQTLQEKRLRQKKSAQESDKRDTVTGILLMVLCVLLSLAAVAGVVVLFVLWSRGRLSNTAVIVTACVIAAAGVLIVLNKK